MHRQTTRQKQPRSHEKTKGNLKKNNKENGKHGVHLFFKISGSMMRWNHKHTDESFDQSRSVFF